MIEAKGKYNVAKIFTDNIDEKALEQIIGLCNEEFVKDSKIRIMPDTHAGAGCTIGTTMTIKDKIVPNLVGVDIGCGMFVTKIEKTKIDFKLLDKMIRQFVPSGFRIRKTPHRFLENINMQDLKCKNKVNLNRASLSVGTLGGGNHFIEMNEDEKGNIYLVIHSGSRHIGLQIAEHYQNMAWDELATFNKDEIIKELKVLGKEKEIQSEIEKRIVKVNKALAYVQGSLFDDYIHDMNIAQKYAEYNRKAIADVIIEKMNFKVEDSFSTIHNYIDIENMILRKGAISAKKGEVVIIPINMRDGSIIATGKGNEDWNNSAPHGAGRLMSRTKAKDNITLEEFQDSMKGIYTTSVLQSTIDEAPFAYKPIEDILDNIGDTVEVNSVIKPIYNFKAS